MPVAKKNICKQGIDPEANLPNLGCAARYTVGNPELPTTCLDGPVLDGFGHFGFSSLIIILCLLKSVELWMWEVIMHLVGVCTSRSRINFWLHCCSAECVFLPVQNLGRPYWLTLAPMYIWIGIFFSQPHKEERFLFPIYPLICLCSAVALSALQVSLWIERFSTFSELIPLGSCWLDSLTSLPKAVNWCNSKNIWDFLPRASYGMN